MKILILLVLLLPFTASAQDCKLKKYNDQFSQIPKISTGFISLGNGRLSIDAEKKEIDFFFALGSTGDTKCFDDASTVTLVFEGGKLKSNYRNTGTMNCEGLFHFTFRNLANTPSALKRISTKKILSITFTGTNKAITVITLTEQQQQQVMEMAACLEQEAKTLL